MTFWSASLTRCTGETERPQRRRHRIGIVGRIGQGAHRRAVGAVADDEREARAVGCCVGGDRGFRDGRGFELRDIHHGLRGSIRGSSVTNTTQALNLAGSSAFYHCAAAFRLR